MKTGKVLLWMLPVAAIAAAACWWVVWARPAQFAGMVGFRTVDGAWEPVPGAKVALYERGNLEGFLAAWWSEHEARVEEAESRLKRARTTWNAARHRREETAKILRVATRANSSDLAACRAKHAEAEEAQMVAYRELERRSRLHEDLGEGRDLLWALPEPEVAAVAGEDGAFVVSAPQRREWLVVVSAPAPEGEMPEFLWIDAPVPGGEVTEFSARNLLTASRLHHLAGHPKATAGEQKKAGESSSPAPDDE